MAKTRQIKDSAFDSMETIVKILTDSRLDEHSQLFVIKQVVYNWSLLLKKIVNE